MKGPQESRSRTSVARALTLLVVVALLLSGLALTLAACGSGEPPMAANSMPTPTVAGTIASEKAIKPSTRSQPLADTDFNTSTTSTSHVRDDTYDGWVFYNTQKPGYQGMRVNMEDELRPSDSIILPDGSTDVGRFRFGYDQSELTLTRAFPGVSVGSQIEITWIAQGESTTSANHFDVRADQGRGFKTLFGSKAEGWNSGTVKFEATGSLIKVQFAGQITEDSADALWHVAVRDLGAPANED